MHPEVLMPTAPSAEGCRPELAPMTTAVCGTPIHRPGFKNKKNSIVVVPLGQKGTPATTISRNSKRLDQVHPTKLSKIKNHSAAKRGQVAFPGPGRLS